MLCVKDLGSAVLWIQFYFFKREDFLGQSCRHFISQTLTVFSSYSGIIKTEKKQTNKPFYSFIFVSLKRDLQFCNKTVSLFSL